MNPEEELRNAMQQRADEVEPNPDSYAHLADKVTSGPAGSIPWWRSPRVLWLGAAGAVAIIVVIGLVVSQDDDPASELATEVPEPTIESIPTVVPPPTPVPTALGPIPSVTPSVTPTPAEDPTPTGPPTQGRPPGVIWPVEAMQPFGEWPDSPEGAARQFVAALGGWDLPLAEVDMLVDPSALLADVTLSSRDEAGEPFGAATVVRVAGGSDENGTPNWGVQWAQSDMIQIDGGTFIDSPPSFEPFGQGWAFESVIEASIVSATGQVAGEGFVTGGGVELQPLAGTIPWTENIPGPGFVLFYDIGGLGLTPTSLTIFPVDIPVRDIPETDPTTCSAAGLEPPPVDAELLAPVEATRQAIAAAAIACDWEALGALLDPLNFSYSFGGGNEPIEFWQQLEADEGAWQPLRFLVETLKLPVAVDDTAEASATIFYSWPDAFVVPWEDVTSAQRDALLALYTEDDLVGFESFGGFIGYRIGIIDDGTWQFFIAGD